MKCPKCDCELSRALVGPAQLDRCSRCGGVWFDFGELEQVLGQEDLSKLKAAVGRDRARDVLRAACPRCGTSGKMIRLAVGDLHIDSCSRCYGQWLDAGELEALQSSGAFRTVADFFREIV